MVCSCFFVTVIETDIAEKCIKYALEIILFYHSYDHHKSVA